MDTTIFDTDTQTQLQREEEKSQEAAKYINDEKRASWFYFCFFLALSFFEYHVLYTVFRHIAGDDNTFWTPSILGFSSAILVVALHFLAARNRHHPTIRFIDGVVEKMTPVYLVGIGLLLSVLLYKYGISAMLDTDHAKLNMKTMQMEGQSWVSWLVVHVLSPLAAIVFSLGFGAISVISIFVASNAFEKASQTKRNSIRLAYNKSANEADIKIYFEALKHFEQAKSELKALYTPSDEALKAEISGELTRNLEQANQQAIESLAKTL